MAKSSTLYSQTKNGFQRPNFLFLREGEQSFAQFRQYWDNNSSQDSYRTDRCLLRTWQSENLWEIDQKSHTLLIFGVSVILADWFRFFFFQSNTNTAPAPLWPQAIHSFQMEMVYNETKSERKSTVIRGMPSLLLKQSAYIPNLTKSMLLLL